MSVRDEQVINFRRVFNTPHGREVLVQRWDDMGLFGTFQNDAGSVALLNQVFHEFTLLGVDFQTHAGRLTFVETLLGIEPQLDDPLNPEEGK